METSKQRGMTGLEEDPAHGLDDWGEDPQSAARRQVQFLEDGLDPAATGTAAAALLDEAYRAAHLLRSALDPVRSPNVIRIARQVQALVSAARKGRIPTGPGVLSLLRTAAHAAAESVDAVSRGRKESASAGEAAAALESFLGGALAAPPVEGDESAPVRYTPIDSRRLSLARAAAAAAAAAATAFARAAEEAARSEALLQSNARRRAELAAEILSAIPQGLAEAARGAPVTEIAQKLAGRMSALAALDEESADAVAGLTARIREAGGAGSRAMEAGTDALAGIDAVSLASALQGVPSAARGLETRMALGDGEIAAALGPAVKAAIVRVLRALAAPRGRKKGRTGKTYRPAGASISIEAHAADGRETIRLSISGIPVDADELASVVSAASRGLARHKAELRTERRRGDRVTLVLTMPSYRRATPGEASFLVVTVKGAPWAIPSRAVVECVPAPLPAAAGWKPEAIIALSEPGKAGAGVVVRGENEPVVVLVDALVGEETLRMSGQQDSPAATSFVSRADGTRIAVFALPGLLSPRREASRSTAATTPGKAPGARSRGAVGSRRTAASRGTAGSRKKR